MRYMTFSTFFLASVSLASSVLAQVPAGPQQVPPAQGSRAPVANEQARGLFFVSDAAGEGQNLGLRVRAYQTVAMPNGSCETVQVPLSKPFLTGDRVRFTVETNRKGFLQILQRGSSGAYSVLFPVNNQPNEIRRGVEVPIPQSGSFVFDATPGVETLYFVFTKKKTNFLNYVLPPAAGAIPAAPAAGSLEGSIFDALQRGQKDLMISGSEQAAAPAPVPNPAAAPFAPAWNGSPFFAVTQGKDYLVVPVQLSHR